MYSVFEGVPVIKRETFTLTVLNDFTKLHTNKQNILPKTLISEKITTNQNSVTMLRCFRVAKR